MELKELKSKYRYCASVAYFSSALFKTHKFKVVDDKEFILKAFKDGNETILLSMENLYKDMLKNDRACEKDLYNMSTPEELKHHCQDSLTLADLVDGVKKLRKSNHRKGYNPQSLANLKRKN